MSQQTLTERFRAARTDDRLAVLEGFHAIKHALRFGAELDEVCCSHEADLSQLCAQLAPDLADRLVRVAEEISPSAFAQLAPRPPRTGILGLARRPVVDLAKVLQDSSPRPLVLIEKPTQHGNVGAVVRVAAAAGAAAVWTLGGVDPWHPTALRGAAGLHFALPVVRYSELPDFQRPLIAVTPGGDPSARSLPARPVLAFGSERDGLSDGLLQMADHRMALPMRVGVSSLNLATSVAAVLYRGDFQDFESEPQF